MHRRSPWGRDASAAATASRERRREAPEPLLWPRPELFLALLTLPVSCQAAGSLLALRTWAALLVAFVVLAALALPVVFIGTLLILILQLAAYPQDRVVFYEVSPSEARHARWPIPVLSGFGVGLRRPLGTWRGATPFGDFLVQSCSVLFDGVIGPVVVRVQPTYRVMQGPPSVSVPMPMDRGVLVPLPAPLRRRGAHDGDVPSAPERRRWARVQHMPLVAAVYKLAQSTVILGLMGAAAARGASMRLPSTATIAGVYAVGTCLGIAYPTLESGLYQLVDTLSSLSQLLMFVTILLAQRMEQSGASDHAKLLYGQVVSKIILGAAVFSAGVQILAQLVQMWDLATSAAGTIRELLKSRSSRASKRKQQKVKTAPPTVTSRHPRVLAAKYANRWTNRVLLRPICGWPWMVPSDAAADELARTVGAMRALREAHDRSLAEAVQATGLACEGRILQVLRAWPALDWARVGRFHGTGAAVQAAQPLAGDDRDAIDVETGATGRQDKRGRKTTLWLAAGAGD